MEERTCYHCGTEISSTRRADAKYCSNVCANRIRNNRYYWNHQDEMRRRRWMHNSDVARRILTRVRSKAKHNNIPCNIELSDIVVPTHCPVLGLELKPNPGKGSGFHPDSPSLDRINPKLGYIKGNVRVISSRANLLKSDATPEELRLVLKDLESVYV